MGAASMDRQTFILNKEVGHVNKSTFKLLYASALTPDK